jgi:hypothetical protein
MRYRAYNGLRLGMTVKTRYFAVSSLLVLVVGLGSGLVAYYQVIPTGALSSRGAPDELRYIPADAALVAYADVRQVMASELRQRFRRAAPGQTGQHELEAQTGINIETDIDHVTASLEAAPSGGNAPSAGIVLASGTFNEVKIEALMRDHGAQVVQYKDRRIIVAPAPTLPNPADPNIPSPEKFSKPPEFALSFLKPGLVALGTSSLIRRAIDLENGGDNVTTNGEVLNLIKSLDSGNAWAVGRFDALRGTGKLPEGMSQLPPISWFSVTGQIGDGINAVVRAETTSDEAAKNLRDVVQGFVALARLQAGSKPELQALIQSLQISGSGKTVALSFSVPGQLIDLIPPAAGQLRNRQPAH